MISSSSSAFSMPEGVESPHQLMEDVGKKRVERVDGVGQVETWGTDPVIIFVPFSSPRRPEVNAVRQGRRLQAPRNSARPDACRPKSKSTS